MTFRAGGQSGFSVIELALAMFLIALLFGTVFVPLRSQIESRKISETEELLARARDALLGYAIANGRFPCPADELSAGQEAAGANAATGTCATYDGYLPAAALGFSASDAQGYARDAWAGPPNRIRYAVTRETVGAAANAHAFTRANGMRSAGIARLSDPALSLLHVCARGRGVSPDTSCGSAPTLVSTAPVVIWSVGPNAATGGRSTDEAQNSNPNGGSADRIFVSRARSEVPENEFDDIVSWIPMPILIGRMIAGGQLP
ncbi:MAG TPA: type II secretion system protein [Burkholderiales bacterium]|nr:type II secretion system protein [Burkholderiales bacterium]